MLSEKLRTKIIKAKLSNQYFYGDWSFVPKKENQHPSGKWIFGAPGGDYKVFEWQNVIIYDGEENKTGPHWLYTVEWK